MERYTPQQRAEIVQLYFENQRSVKLVFRKLRPIYGQHNRPSETTIGNIVKKFQSEFTCLDLPRAGRPLTG